MPDDNGFSTASDLLYHHWTKGSVLLAIPKPLRPSTRAAAYAVQAGLEPRSGQPLFGWKIAGTSTAGQRHINIDGPLAGRILAERVVPEGEPVQLGANRMLVAEIEFAFKMAADLPPRAQPYGKAEVMAAVGALHLAVEVPDSRYADFCAVGAAQLIADNACADQFVLGQAVPTDWRRLDLAVLRVRGKVVGGVTHDGQGANALGDPRTALTWLANELSAHGVTLKAGQVVTTGTCVVPLPVKPGMTVVGDYGELGRIEVSFTA